MPSNPISTQALPGAALTLIQHQLLDEIPARCYQQQAFEKNQSLVRHLVSSHLLPAATIAQTLAQHYCLPYFDLNAIDPGSLPLELLPEPLIRQYQVLPLSIENKQLRIALDHLDNPDLLKTLQFHSRFVIKPVIVESDKLAQYIAHTLQQKHQQGLIDYVAELPLANEDDRIVQFVQSIFAEAIEMRVSDIHFEPYQSDYRIRFRKDGLLMEVRQTPVALSSRIASYLKIMANLDISEKRLPQDGRFKLEGSMPHPIDCRLSTCPTINGEKIVIRLLDLQVTQLNLDALGFNTYQRHLLDHALHQPQGMLLVTGPTGSGKTLTLYSALNQLNTSEKNITSVEDPVEMKLHGINQVQVNPKAGLTFSKTLRAFLRQDPDVMMVGEIRDQETAEIAIKAALTGHLILATLHTNNAVDSLIRLKNLHIPGFNLASCISLIIAQRLVRTLCSACKTPHADIQNKLGLGADTLQYRAVGCSRCFQGYNGRTGLFEVLPMSAPIKSLLLTDAHATAIFTQAQLEGMRTLYQSGLEKVQQGLTTLEEVRRVCIE